MLYLCSFVDLSLLYLNTNWRGESSQSLDSITVETHKALVRLGDPTWFGQCDLRTADLNAGEDSLLDLNV